jgi:hypothetical protein
VDPIQNIEFKRYQYDFQKMKKSTHCPEYNTENYFPTGINFKERSKDYPSYKKKILSAYPEQEEASHARSITLIEDINKRIKYEC